jgi:hypothetical protein
LSKNAEISGRADTIRNVSLEAEFSEFELILY